MIKLCANSLEITMLEWELRVHGIPHLVVVNPPDCGLEFPYLIVDGVPLDEERAMKWIKERDAHE